MGYLTDNEAALLGVREGQSKALCPWCSMDRRDRLTKCLSVNRSSDTILYNCWHCGVSGAIKDRHTAGEPAFRRGERGTMPGSGSDSIDELFTASPALGGVGHPSQYSPSSQSTGYFQDSDTKRDPICPQKTRLCYTPLSAAGLGFLASRGISSATAESLGILSTTCWFNKMHGEGEGVAFPYRGGFKIRYIADKAFTTDGKPVGVFPGTTGPHAGTHIVCEGELDAASFREAGIDGAFSIPHGAIQPGHSSDSKLGFIAEMSLDSVEKIVIATDSDAPGRATAEELARRLGRHRCWSIQWPDGCKDANDVLTKIGRDALRALVESATPWPIEGLFGVSAFAGKVEELYLKGLGRGLSTGYPCLDEFYSISPGLLTVVTGVPGDGKSEFVDQLMVNLASDLGWKFAVCSFENPPPLHIAKLMAKRERKPFFEGPTKRMDSHEVERSRDWVQEHFSFLHSESGEMATIESIIERLKVAVMRHGIRGAVIDPYNYIVRPNEVSETQWISDMLSKICSFTRAHDIHLWFVAHPTKMRRGEDGSIPVAKGFDISGSAGWFAKADFGITVHRPDPVHSYRADIHVWKARFGWMGRNGECSLVYDPATFSYSEIPVRTGPKYSSFDLD